MDNLKYENPCNKCESPHQCAVCEFNPHSQAYIDEDDLYEKLQYDYNGCNVIGIED